MNLALTTPARPVRPRHLAPRSAVHGALLLGLGLVHVAQLLAEVKLRRVSLVHVLQLNQRRVVRLVHASTAGWEKKRGGGGECPRFCAKGNRERTTSAAGERRETPSSILRRDAHLRPTTDGRKGAGTPRRRSEHDRACSGGRATPERLANGSRHAIVPAFRISRRSSRSPPRRASRAKNPPGFRRSRRARRATRGRGSAVGPSTYRL